jgi:hypothetical protein
MITSVVIQKEKGKGKASEPLELIPEQAFFPFTFFLSFS